MTAPEDRIYCGDAWCDGDHTFHGDRCEGVSECEDDAPEGVRLQS